MFESAELGRSLSKSEYKSLLPKLRNDLLQAQFAMQSTHSPVIIIIEGVDNAVKGEVVNRLNEWFDTRGVEVNAFGKKSDEEAERPKFWRYWQSLPSRGRMALFSGSWYTGPLIQRTFKELKSSEFDEQMNSINIFERMLADDGAIILKFWLHMSEKYQEKSFKEFEEKEDSRFRVSEADLRLHKCHTEYTSVAKQAVMLTDELHAPWIIIEAEDEYYRDVTVANTILSALNQRLENPVDKGQQEEPVAFVRPPEVGIENTRNVLDKVKLSKELEKSEYNDELKRYQKELNELSWKAFHKKKSMVLLFEGWDAAGKGGVIRRVNQAIDARVSRVISVAAPTDEELSHHYLWRFWRHIPKAGHVTMYDRSWYGRVLVERVEGFATDNEWGRSYGEINEFEKQLTDHGIVLCKFWLHIDKDEQLARFKEREVTPYKQHKITDEDWRNRDRWDDYEIAISDMVAKTSTNYAPWTLVPGTSKLYARIQILKTICKTLKKALKNSE